MQMRCIEFSVNFLKNLFIFNRLQRIAYPAYFPTQPTIQ